MNKNQIIAMQRRVGVTPDGFWGPVSQAALRTHLRALMPQPHPWPASTTAALTKFYGAAGNENNLVVVPFPYPAYYEGKLVKTFRCHKRVAESLSRVLESIKGKFKSNPDIVDEASDYAGCFNNRNKRGGSSKSLHAWGAAIDLDADDNSFKNTWPVSADMPLEIIEAFAREGWVSAAAFWGYDAMHFQATAV